MASPQYLAHRLSPKEALALWHLPFYELLELSKKERERRFGKKATYVINRQINPTNICVLTCEHCGFARKKGQAGAWAMTPKEAASLISGREDEVHITGGLHPDWGLDYYVLLLKEIRKKVPRACIKALTAIEIDYLHRKEKLSIPKVLEILQEAGLNMLPGGGAEIFSERLARQYFPSKTSSERWLQVHEIAHQRGIPSNATMLFGLGETPEEILHHLTLLRDLQDRTKGFQAFIPLALQPGKLRLSPNIPSPQYCLKVLAISRLYLDNFPHIKAYWIMLGLETALMGLVVAADDLGGTIGKETIAHMAGAESPEGISLDQAENWITSVGLIPVRRDGFYNALCA